MNLTGKISHCSGIPLMCVNEYFKRMKVFVVFPVLFGPLAHMLIMVKPHAAIPSDYEAVLFPGNRIHRWNQPRENHYKFERTFVIGRNHPHDRYSSLKLFWPEDTSPYYNRDRITFYECINRTPTAAKTLMHIIRGGMGTPELVVDVMYAPVRYRLVDRVIITCHIYTERNDSLINRQSESWNLFDSEEDNDRIKPGKGQGVVANSTLGTTAVSPGTTSFMERSSTVALKSTTQRSTGSGTTSKETRKKTGNPAKQRNKVDSKSKKRTKQDNGSQKVSGKGTTPGADVKKIRRKGTTKEMETTTQRVKKTNRGGKIGEEILTGDKTTKSSFRIIKPIPRTSSEQSTKKARSKAGKSKLKAGKTAPGITSPKTDEVTSKKRVLSPKISNTTPHMGCGCSKPENPTKTQKEQTNLGTNEIYSTVMGTSLKEETTTLKVTSLKQKTGEEGTVIGRIEMNDDNDSGDEKMNKTIIRGDKILRMNRVESTTKNGTSKRLDENHVFTKGKKSSKIEDTTQKQSTSALHKLVLKTMKNKKIGLAKITYK